MRPRHSLPRSFWRTRWTGSLRNTWAGLRRACWRRGYPDPTRPGKLCGVVTLHGIQAADVNSAGRTKQYWFDMNTNRLVRAVHAETGAEVRFVEYASSQGNEFPTKIQVFQGGTLSVTYVIVPAGVSAQANDGLFGGN